MFPDRDRRNTAQRTRITHLVQAWSSRGAATRAPRRFARDRPGMATRQRRHRGPTGDPRRRTESSRSWTRSSPSVVRNARSWISIGVSVTSDGWFTPPRITGDNENLSPAKHAPRRPWRPSAEGEAKSVLGPGGQLPTEGASGGRWATVTRWCEKAEPTRSGRLWAPTEG